MGNNSRIFAITAPMGAGKTLYATCYAISYAESHPDNTVYANYAITDLPHFVYSPLMILPFDEIHDCLLIVDDIYALRNVTALIAIIVNMSRKRNVEVVITCQYYTMIPPQIRQVCQQVTVMHFTRAGQVGLACEISQPVREGVVLTQNFLVRDVDRYYARYSTDEVVAFVTQDALLQELLKFTRTLDDMHRNLELISRNKAERAALEKSIRAANGWEVPPAPRARQRRQA